MSKDIFRTFTYRGYKLIPLEPKNAYTFWKVEDPVTGDRFKPQFRFAQLAKDFVDRHKESLGEA